MKILIAEDERISRRSLQRQLQRWGHEVSAAENGREAWEMFQEGEFSIVVSDWMMPEMKGPELVRQIRGFETQRYVYVILLTAKSEKSDIVAGMEAGADDFLSKPFDRNELHVRLRAGERIIELERNLAQRNLLLNQANERMKRDLGAAAKVQQALLPTCLPQTSKAEFAWSYKPCDELAGDFLNVFSLDEQHVAMYVADVSGHGVAASLLSVTISRVLTAQLSASSLLVRRDNDCAEARIVPPAEVAGELNHRFPMEEWSERYFTIVYGVLNTVTRVFRYVSAGHPPIMWLRPGEQPQPLEAEGLAIGWVPDVEYEEHSIELAPGDRLWLYSDGVPEATDTELEQFGDDRLAAAISRHASRPLEEDVSGLLRDVERWCGQEGPKDDVSILAAEVC